MPLQSNGRAMAEHQQLAQPCFFLHGLEAEQGAEGFTCSWTGMDKHISALLGVGNQATPDEMDQLLLPETRSQRGLR